MTGHRLSFSGEGPSSRWHATLASLQRIAFDTDALIYGLQTEPRFTPLMAQAFQAMHKGELSAIVSTVVELEILVKPFRDGDQDALDTIEYLFREMPGLIVRNVDGTVARRAAEIRARTGLLAPDAIIAETALEERCDAIIGNDAAFSRKFARIPYLMLSTYAH